MASKRKKSQSGRDPSRTRRRFTQEFNLARRVSFLSGRSGRRKWRES